MNLKVVPPGKHNFNFYVSATIFKTTEAKIIETFSNR